MVDVTRRIDVDPETGTVRANYDPDCESPSRVVVAVVASVGGVDEAELTPLYDVIDPEALDALVRQSGHRDRNGDPSVAFEYEGFQVTIASDGTVELRPTSREEESSRRQ